MIPRLIHQTWADKHIPPRYDDWVRSWKAMNPDWAYKLWTDADLDQLVADYYPAFLETFRAYKNPIERADAGRYLVLHHQGGVYADLDTRCFASLDPFREEERVILAEEPQAHWSAQAETRGMAFLLFNGVMASPQGHPFWMHLLDKLRICRFAGDPLDSTGPNVLTGAALDFPDRSALALHSCHIFNPVNAQGALDSGPERGPYAPRRICTHYWMGSWYAVWQHSRWRRIKGGLRRMVHKARQRDVLKPAAAKAAVDCDRLARTPFPSDPAGNVAVLIPIRNAAKHVTRCVELVTSLDIPKDKLKVVFCEGDSTDGTAAALESALPSLAARCRDARLLRLDLGQPRYRRKRWDPRIQRERRGRIAQTRNHLIRHGLDEEDDWALWIDADVCGYPPDIVHRLVSAGERIAVPNCVLAPGDSSYDLNSYLTIGEAVPAVYYKHCRAGLFQPPPVFGGRRHLHDLRYLDNVRLSGVGGTMLLVHADVHRAGVEFPVKPYRDLIETEAFGQLANDLGIRVVGLPNLEIFHVAE